MAEQGSRATHGNVHELAAELRFDEATYRRALELAGLVPSRDDWRRYLSAFLLAFGVLLVVAGVAAFVAANWAAIGDAGRFGLIEVALVAAVVAAWWLGIDTPAGRAALAGAAGLVGVLLALYGQVYQTGADPYGLFLGWAILVLPWALAGRQAALWILELVLANLAVIFYWTQVLHPPDGWWSLAQLFGPLVWLGTTVTDYRLGTWLFALNASGLVLWEWIAARGVRWAQGRSFSRVAAVLALGTVVPPTLLMVFAAAAGGELRLSVVSPVLFVLASAGCLTWFRYRRRDLLILTVCLTGIGLVITALAIRYLIESVAGGLLIAALLTAEVAAAAWWLRRVAEQWERET